MIKGKIAIYFETGMEGCEWAVCEEGKPGYDGLNFLKDGDKLKIYDEEKIIWDGIIKKDTQTNLTDKTSYPYPRQVVKGIIFHWVQQDENPERWFRWFEENKECELERKIKE